MADAAPLDRPSAGGRGRTMGRTATTEK